MDTSLIDVNDFNVEQLSYQPSIARVKGFLTEDECQHLIESSQHKLRPCNEIAAGVNRTGWGVFMREGEENHPVVQRILKKMEQFVPVNNDSEVMQVIRYDSGAKALPKQSTITKKYISYFP